MIFKAISRYFVIPLILTLLLLVIYSQVTSNTPLLLLSFLSIALITICNYKKDFLPIMFTLLPFASITKISPSGYTLFSIIFLLVLFIFSVKNQFNYDAKIIITVSVLFLTTLIPQFLHGLHINPGYILFFALLIFIPSYLKSLNGVYHFRKITYAFSSSLIIASSLAYFTAGIPQISKFLVSFATESTNIVRFFGFSSDPNYYGGEITAAIACLAVLILMTNKLTIKVINIVLISVLFYFGTLSISKSFIIVSIFIMFLATVSYITARSVTAVEKIVIASLMLILGTILYAQNIFGTQVSLYNERLSNVVDVNSLTTNRLTLFGDYYNYALGSFERLFIGQGYNNSYDPTLLKASHNTIIQIVYQFGVVGIVVLFSWYRRMMNIINNIDGLNKAQVLIVGILIIGLFLPWLSLDMLFSEEFIYIIALYIIGVSYVKNKDNIKVHSKQPNTSIGVAL